jgi:hypothetical protein
MEKKEFEMILHRLDEIQDYLQGNAIPEKTVKELWAEIHLYASLGMGITTPSCLAVPDLTEEQKDAFKTLYSVTESDLAVNKLFFSLRKSLTPDGVNFLLENFIKTSPVILTSIMKKKAYIKAFCSLASCTFADSDVEKIRRSLSEVAYKREKQILEK